MRIIGFLVALAGIIGGSYLGGFPVLRLIDIPSFVIIFVPIAGVGIAVAGLKDTFYVCYFVFFTEKVPPEKRKYFISLFYTLENVSLGAGIIGFLTGCMQVLPHLSSDPDAIGRGIMVSLICPVYGLTIKYIFLLPARNRIQYLCES